MNGLPILPTVATDMAGSVANVVFAFLAMRYAYLLTRRQPENFLWGYLFYICLAIAAFSISRAAGHIVKQLLLMNGQEHIWKTMAPVSGGFNTLLIISVSAVTIFYHKGVQAYNLIGQKAAKLKEANQSLQRAAEERKELNRHLEEMNVHLEEKVEERARELAHSEKKFRHLFEASRDMVFFCDMEHHILEINRSGLEMLGYGPEDINGLTFKRIFHHRGDIDLYFKQISQQGFLKDMEVEFRRKDGSLMYVLLSATAVYDDSGNMIGCEAIAKDLTRIKAMMEQLIASEKMASVGQMAAGVAHEINTPLGIILGYAQLMMDDFDENSDVYQNLKVIERQTKASRRIVADLLKFSRQSGGARENLDLNEVVRDVVAVTAHNLSLDHIGIHVDLQEDLPSIIGDVEKLRQVFVNLINNAHYAMKEYQSGDLYFRTFYDHKNRQVVAEVRDTGPGISEEVKARIFDPFFTTKPVGSGTGLGLAVSYGIIKDHGGTIEVHSPISESDSSRSGTLFTVRIPVMGEIPPVAMR